MTGTPRSERGEFTTGEVCSTSGEPFKSNDKSAGEGWGWRGRLERCFSCLFSGPAGESRGGGSGTLGSFPASRAPLASPQPPAPPEAAPAPRGRQRRAPPTLSRSLASPVQALPGGGGGGAEGIAAIERRENPALARQSVESHSHIKMPY